MRSCQKSQKPVGKGGEFQWDFPSCTVVGVWVELVRARVTSPSANWASGRLFRQEYDSYFGQIFDKKAEK